MNIRQAAAQLEQAVRAYTARTDGGGYRVSLAAQRPLYLMGPPGVGKTAVVAQVAAKLNIGYAAYTMTHHTRQSALGLPLIVHKTLGGEARAVTEYTMSEIVASVWQRVEDGAETGILFLDEINCVSESLMPAMLQLLQYKTFGVHPLPRGWIVVCAGNPPRYNRYAHTFDAVVMDRLRVIEVEPELSAWQAFAVQRGAHPIIRSYLSMKGDDFYVADGDRIVTARSWTDLSDMLLAMEAEGLPADDSLFRQYLQVDEVAEHFSLYFRLCGDLGARLDEALDGGASLDIDALPFDEAVFAALFLAGRMEAQADAASRTAHDAERLAYFAEGVLRELDPASQGAEALCADHLSRQRQALAVRISAGIADEAATAREEAFFRRVDGLIASLHGLTDGESTRALQVHADKAKRNASAEENRLFASYDRELGFIERSIADPNLRLILLNDLKAHAAANRFMQARFKTRFDTLWRTADPEARLTDPNTDGGHREGATL